MTIENREKLEALFLLSIRVLLAGIFISYGYAKLVHDQFGLYDKLVLEQPLKKVSSFQLSWYLFGLEEPFKYVIGIMQIITGFLLFFHRTYIIGALLYLPIIIGIILINISYVKIDVLSIRTVNYLILDIVLLYFNRNQLRIAFNMLLIKCELSLKKNYKIIFGAILIAILIEFGCGIFFNLLLHLIHKLNA